MSRSKYFQALTALVVKLKLVDDEKMYYSLYEYQKWKDYMKAHDLGNFHWS